MRRFDVIGRSIGLFRGPLHQLSNSYNYGPDSGATTPRGECAMVLILITVALTEIAFEFLLMGTWF